MAARDRVALGIVEGDAFVTTGEVGIGVDLEVRRDGVVALVPAHDVEVTAVAQVDGVTVAAARVVAERALDDEPVGMAGEERILVLPVADVAEHRDAFLVLVGREPGAHGAHAVVAAHQLEPVHRDVVGRLEVEAGSPAAAAAVDDRAR